MLFLKKAETIRKKAEKQYKKTRQKLIKQFKHTIITHIKLDSNQGLSKTSYFIRNNDDDYNKSSTLLEEEKSILKNYFTSKGYIIDVQEDYHGETWTISWTEKREGEV